jgi:transposase-like protein
VQRCAVHKWQNLVKHCPAHAQRELKRDYDRIVYAKSGLAAREAYEGLVGKWSKLCPAVARSLEEAGEQLRPFPCHASRKKGRRSTSHQPSSESTKRSTMAPPAQDPSGMSR